MRPASKDPAVTVVINQWTRKALVFPPNNNINPPVIKLGGVGALFGPTGTTLLRTMIGLWCFASVGDPTVTSVPPEDWWGRLELSFQVRVSNVSSTDYGSAYSADENTVLTGNLYPSIFAPSTTAPAEYQVGFRIDENSVESHGQRKWDGTGPGFWVIPQINFHDYEAAIDAGVYPGINFSAWGYMRNLWRLT